MPLVEYMQNRVGLCGSYGPSKELYILLPMREVSLVIISGIIAEVVDLLHFKSPIDFQKYAEKD